MKAPARRCSVLLALALASAASARTDVPRDGSCFGGKVGDASASSCNGWALHGAALVLGETFQTQRLVWGIGADLDFWGTKTLNQSLNSAAACSGIAAACAGFSGISFDNAREGVGANLFRVGVTYWFGYW